MMAPRYEGMKNLEDWEEFYVTRETYERILRGFVLGSSTRIRWITGTATGISLSRDDRDRVDCVSIRTRSGDEITVPAALVIGRCHIFSLTRNIA